MKKLFKQLALAIFRGKYAPKSFSKWLVLFFDCCILFAAFWIYVFIKYLYNIHDMSILGDIIRFEFIHFLPLLVIFLINSFIFGSYQGLVRYSGFSDIKKIGYVCLGTFILAFMTKSIAVRFLPSEYINTLFVSHTETVFIAMLTFVIMTLSRLVIRRIYNENICHKQEIKNWQK